MQSCSTLVDKDQSFLHAVRTHKEILFLLLLLLLLTCREPQAMRSFTTSTVLAIGALFSVVSGHFTLDYPQTRGFDEDIEDDNFCGGFHNVSAKRAPWYYKNGPVQIDSHHDAATVNIYISFDVPTSSESFLRTSSGVKLPTLRNDLALTGQGEFCFHANAGNINVAGVNVRDGTNATIMVEFINNVHGHLYQCSDVTFSSDASVGSNITCTDALTATAGSSADDDDTGASSTTASRTSSTAPGPSASVSNASGSQRNGVSRHSASPAGIVLLGLAVLAALSSVL